MLAKIRTLPYDSCNVFSSAMVVEFKRESREQKMLIKLKFVKVKLSWKKLLSAQ